MTDGSGRGARTSRRKSMPAAALARLDDEGTLLPEKRIINAAASNADRRSDKRRRASLALGGPFRSPRSGILKPSLVHKTGDAGNSDVEDKENGGTQNLLTGPALLEMNKSKKDYDDDFERRKRRLSRKSLGRRVSFAPTAHVRMFEVQDDEHPQSPDRPVQHRSLLDDSNPDVAPNSLALSSVSKPRFQIPDLATTDSDSGRTIDLGLGLENTSDPGKAGDSTAVDTEPSRPNDESSFEVSVDGSASDMSISYIDLDNRVGPQDQGRGVLPVRSRRRSRRLSSLSASSDAIIENTASDLRAQESDAPDETVTMDIT
ncbi:hypothetical protein EV182_004681, partial [Spiromyces aspiralis]